MQQFIFCPFLKIGSVCVEMRRKVEIGRKKKEDNHKNVK